MYHTCSLLLFRSKLMIILESPSTSIFSTLSLICNFTPSTSSLLFMTHVEIKKKNTSYSSLLLLTFGVILKMSKPCFWVLHETWCTWCVFIPWMVQYGLTHDIWSIMNVHNGDNLLSDCLTSIRCWLGTLPLSIGVLDKLRDILQDGHMEMFTHIEIDLLWRSIMHHRRGHQALDGMG
jgi:hypothetical protein